MPYARKNWKAHELKIALANPVHAIGGPDAHSSKHAVSGELANHPLFQKARVNAVVTSGNASQSNAHFHAKGLDGSWVKKDDGTNLHSNSVRKNNPLPKPEASRHSALDVELIAAALVNALNCDAMQIHLQTLDAGNPMKVHVNFSDSIGKGNIHQSGMASQIGVNFISLFVYCKPNPGNSDVPIFQTIVPSSQNKLDGSDPIITM